MRAAVAAASALGAAVPWTPRSTSPKISLLDRFFIGIFEKFGRIAIKRGKQCSGNKMVVDCSALLFHRAGDIAWLRHTGLSMVYFIYFRKTCILFSGIICVDLHIYVSYLFSSNLQILQSLLVVIIKWPCCDVYKRQ
jgi:hypothetical protein